MIRRSLIPSLCFLLSSLVGLPAAQAGYLTITFEGSAYGSDSGGPSPHDGERVTGSFLIDLDMEQTRRTDDWGSTVYGSAGQDRYITSQISIGDSNFVLGPSSAGESVLMDRTYLGDDSAWDSMEISDNYSYENDVGSGSISLKIFITGPLNSFLNSLDLDQEFLLVDESISAWGTFDAQTEYGGIDWTRLSLNRMQASRVPSAVPEPAPIGTLLTALLVGMGLRRRNRCH